VKGVVRLLAVVLVIAAVGCGGASSTHYDEAHALQCVRQTNSLLIHSMPHGMLVAFASPDGVSAVEQVAVAFAPQPIEIVADSAAPTRLGIVKPDWSEHRGDAEVWGVGPYEPAIAKRRKIPDAQVRAAMKALGTEVRAAIDGCLKQNER
jgi:hypothetical protein